MALGSRVGGTGVGMVTGGAAIGVVSGWVALMLGWWSLWSRWIPCSEVEYALVMSGLRTCVIDALPSRDM